ncbi:hypothetical protein LCGC14_0377110 [marine sediment metagenome]|uniref:Uncharacterized protein n=1 Tax=marine sediment metagenome TaxID=412755 RepID=A0A0F9T3L9_9ZZZZ
MYDHDKAIDGCVEPVLTALGLGAMKAALDLPPRSEEPFATEHDTLPDDPESEEEMF